MASDWTAGPKICEVGGVGMLLPLGRDDENQWPDVLRVILYGLGMIYLFIGIAIIADGFVASIEAITARKSQHKTKSGQTLTKNVWNDTVATLSLMALGSSAPEISLSIVDLFKKEFHFSPLGAQTISGSAAFNLLVIVAVCIMIIPSTETRLVQELPAFYVTAAVSVFAYFWLALILIVRTPDVVEVWEAILTFLYLPMLIWVSYKVDVGDFGRLAQRLGWAVEPAEVKPESDMALIGFPFDELTVEANPDEAKTVEVVVKRPENTTGNISVAYHTFGLRATPGYDYTDVQQGRLEFSEDDSEHAISIEILPKAVNRVDRKFLLILDDPEGDVEFDGETDGGKDAAIMTVTITTPSSKGSKLVRSVEAVVNFNGIHRGAVDWKEQMTSCIYCCGSPEEQKEATMVDWALHIISLPWKLLFTLVPPTTLWGGWACFYSSLGGIGIVTVVISDLAELFGCVLGIRDDVTAIVFVALGTSMPDLFASLSAAREEPTADASIVNVTGSNSVNVFLGLGLPWTIGAIYWAVSGPAGDWQMRYSNLPHVMGPDGTAVFVVESRNLGFCVMIFGAACTMAFLILHCRRRFLGAELGGPFVPKIVSGVAFISYWLGFIGVSSWRVDRWDASTMLEASLVILGTGSFELLVTLVAVVIIIIYRQRSSGGGEASAVEQPVSFRRSQSALSNGSNSSRGSRGSKNKEHSSLSEGVTGVSGVKGVGISMLKPRFVNQVCEQMI
mmetsp:Transcript_78872/g.231484  ORF Transcript_78872/g.231484 Transcript_78872/m.231484 type:complete len:732 (+) Transcript_78872:151-2346(+)